VTTRLHGRIRLVRLNRPEKLNAADLAMQRGLLAALTAGVADPSTGAVVLTGAGRAFCSGGDLALVRELNAGDSPLGDELGRITFALLELMLTRELPVVAAVNGPAIGFGAALLALCDVVVLAASAYVCEPHAKYGLAPSPACALVWPHLTSRTVARELLLSGRRVGAEEAVRLGLANRAVADGTELTAALQLAEELAAAPAAGIAAVLRDLNGPLLAQARRELTWPTPAGGTRAGTGQEPREGRAG
jgi:enoyl-CoA hydratase/carnithine racemase